MPVSIFLCRIWNPLHCEQTPGLVLCRYPAEGFLWWGDSGYGQTLKRPDWHFPVFLLRPPGRGGWSASPILEGWASQPSEESFVCYLLINTQANALKIHDRRYYIIMLLWQPDGQRREKNNCKLKAYNHSFLNKRFTNSFRCTITSCVVHILYRSRVSHYPIDVVRENKGMDLPLTFTK